MSMYINKIQARESFLNIAVMRIANILRFPLLMDCSISATGDLANVHHHMCSSSLNGL